MVSEDILSLLIAERDKLNRAIAALKGVGRGGRRPGRPPKAAGGRKGMSAAARKRQSQRMKAYWAARRKGKASA